MSASEAIAGVPSLTLGWRLKMSLDHPLTRGEDAVTAGEMSALLGYSKSQVSRFMNDKGEPPRDLVLRQWAVRCGVSFEWLKHGIVDPESPDGVGVSPSAWYGDVVDLGARRANALAGPARSVGIAA